MIKWPSWLVISYTRKRKGHWRAAKNISIHQVSLLIIWTRYAVHQGNFDHIKIVFVNFFHRCAFNFRKTCFFGQPSEQIQGWAKFPISLIIHEYKISGNFIPDFIRTWDTQQLNIYIHYILRCERQWKTFAPTEVMKKGCYSVCQRFCGIGISAVQTVKPLFLVGAQLN